MTDDSPKEEHVTSGFAMRMLVECDHVYRERLLKQLDEVSKHITLGWELIPELSHYRLEYKKKPNKYQRRYARIGRRMKNRR